MRSFQAKSRRIEKLCDSISRWLGSGLCCYVGKCTLSMEDMREFRLGGSIKKLVETLKKDQDTFILTDRYSTGLKIAEHLVEQNIF